MTPDKPLNIDDFTKVMPLTKGYELDPSKVYLIVVDGKDFQPNAIHSLMRDIQQMHPDLNIAVVATLKPKSIKVRMKDGPAEAVPGNTEAGSGPGSPSGSTDSEGGR